MKRTIEKLDISWLEQTLLPVEKKSIVLFDIDSTIMDTSHRNYRILIEAEKEFTYLNGISDKIAHDEIGWDVTDAVQRLIHLDDQQISEVHSFWENRFFYDEWLSFETPYDGIHEVLNWFIEHDIMIIYLTGRDEKHMKNGTIDSFENHGIPIGKTTKFLFKPSQQIEDLTFKKEAFSQIRKQGRVILAVENEPANANAMKKAFPDATIALIDTVTTPNPEEPEPEIILFNSY